MKAPRLVRSLAAHPAYSAASILVLSFGIASLLAIVAIVEALLFRPPTARSPETLVMVQSSLPNGIISLPDFKDIRERTKGLSSVFAYRTDPNVGLVVDNKLFTVRNCLTSAALFRALDVVPEAGRLLEESDDVPNAAPVAVISSEFANDANLRPGDSFRIGKQPFTVCGIVPAAFTSLESVQSIDVWIPLAHYDAVLPKWALNNRAFQPINCGARLKPGVTIGAASGELGVLAQQLQKENPVDNHGMGLRAESLTQFRFEQNQSTRTIVFLGALVVSLFALAFTNFFALTMLRLLQRNRELAVRVAVGATWSHLARSLVAEVLTIAAVSTVLGCGLAFGLLRLGTLDPKVGALLSGAGVRIDGLALAIIVATVLLCSLAVWLLALRQAARVDVMAAIKESASAPNRQGAFSRLLGLQLGLTVFLVVMAFSFGDALRREALRGYPFRTHNVLLIDISFRNLGYDGDARIGPAERFLDRLRETPGVIAAGATSNAPLDRAGWTNVTVNGHDPALDPDKCITGQTEITDGYFEASEVKLLGGRTLDRHDVERKPNVAVINAAAVRRFWPRQNALGASFKPWEEGPLFTVVGIVDDLPMSNSGGAFPSIYLTWGRIAGTHLTFFVDVREDTAAVRQNIEQTIRTLWPFERLPEIHTMQEHISGASAELLTAVRVILSIAVLATIVTACGLYFFSSYTANQSRKETAIRQALGARVGDLVRAHARRYRAGIAAGAMLGAALLIVAQFVLARLNIVSAPLHWIPVATAVAGLAVIAILGLAMPLIRTLRHDLVRLLRGND